MDNSILKIVESVSETFVKNKIIGGCLCASIIIVEKLRLINIASKVVEGYYICDNYYGRHYWVRINSETVLQKDIDIGTYILCKILSKCIDVTLSYDEPKNNERVDMGNSDEKSTLIILEQGYNIYRKYGIKQFFKQSSKKLKRLKDALLNNIS